MDFREKNKGATYPDFWPLNRYQAPVSQFASAGATLEANFELTSKEIVL